MRKKRNDIGKERNKKCNKYDLIGCYGVGYTSNTNKEFYFDLEDYIKIKDHTWLEKNGYIVTAIKKKTTRMHKLITNTNKNQQIDHINRKRYDNRKENLRIVTSQENARNRKLNPENKSGIVGVYWDNHYSKWRSNLKIKDKQLNNYFFNKNDAIICRLKWELEYFGKDFAPQRHLFEEYGIK